MKRLRTDGIDAALFKALLPFPAFGFSSDRSAWQLVRNRSTRFRNVAALNGRSTSASEPIPAVITLEITEGFDTNRIGISILFRFIRRNSSTPLTGCISRSATTSSNSNSFINASASPVSQVPVILCPGACRALQVKSSETASACTTRIRTIFKSLPDRLNAGRDI